MSMDPMARDPLFVELERLREQVGDARHGMLIARAERDTALRDLAIAYGRNECGQRFPGQAQLTRAARVVARRNGWPDPYPETGAPEGAAAVGTWPGEETEAELLAQERHAGGTDDQATLDAKAHAQLEGQHAAAGGASGAEVRALEGLPAREPSGFDALIGALPLELADGERRCEGCGGVGGSEECGDCDACRGRGKVLP